MEASVKMLVYVVNIFTMFVGPDSWGDVTEAGLEEAIFDYLLKKEKTFTVLLWCIKLMYFVVQFYPVQILFAFVLRCDNIC